MTKELSAKQKLFSQNLAKGLTQTQAYIDAGYSPNGADGAACKLQGNARIKEYVDELMKPAEDAIRLTAEKVHRRLHDIAMDCPEGFTGADSIRAIAEFNKMSGGYTPEKLEVSPFGKMLARVRAKRD